MATKQNPARLTNGYLDSLDGRLSVAQSMRDRFRAFTDDLGGIDALTYPQRGMVERAVWLEYCLAQQEQCLARGHSVDMDSYTQGVNAYRELITGLGAAHDEQ